jgi:hypothetical protein
VSWQLRHGFPYYYHSYRLPGGRVRCLYLGTGPPAELAATWDQMRRLERLEAREKRQAALAQRQEVDGTLDRLCEATTLLARATLLAAGYHQHDRGEWRKKRVPKTGS